MQGAIQVLCFTFFDFTFNDRVTCCTLLVVPQCPLVDNRSRRPRITTRRQTSTVFLGSLADDETRHMNVAFSVVV